MAVYQMTLQKRYYWNTIQVVLATAIGRVAQTGTALDVVDPTDPITILAPLVAVLWPRGDPPSVTDGAGQIDRLAFTYIDGDWLGSEAGAGFA